MPFVIAHLQIFHRTHHRVIPKSDLYFTFCSTLNALSKAMFTLYRVVKRSVAERVPDRASVHTRNAAFEAVSAPEQYCSAVESGTSSIR